MRARAAAVTILAVAVLAGAGSAPAQLLPPLTLDPSAAGQGSALVVSADDTLLAPKGKVAGALTFALPRGMRFDTRSREALCSARGAARGTCPDSSRIGVGRFGLAVRGYELAGGGETELIWALDAFLGEPQRRGDAASIVLVGHLLGADLVTALLEPSLGTKLPAATTTIGTIVQRRSGPYGIEIELPKLPVQVAVAAPASATPSRLELTLSGVRRIRQNFTRHFKVRTESGVQVRNVRDHRLVGRYLFQAPARCGGTWPFELRADVDGAVERTTRRVACTTGTTPG